MQVLIAIDGSPASFEAIRQVGRLLSPEGDKIAVYYSPPGWDLAASAGCSTVHRGRLSLAEAVFEQALSYLPVEWPVNIQTIVGTIDPRQGILDAAEDCRAELLVVGARGLGAVERLLLGSVSRTVAHSAKIPVFIARPPATISNTPEVRVLLACDSQQSGQRLAKALHRFTWPVGASVLILHVVENIFGGKIPEWLEAQARSPEAESFVKLWVKDHDEQLASASQEVRAVCKDLPAALATGDTRVSEGVPEREILQAARELRSDLIVVGAKGSTHLGRLLIGGTSEAILNHAPCSVLLVHHE